MDKKYTFEKYLENVFEDSSASDGVLDDDLQDRFDDFLANLDCEVWLSYADEFALKQYNLGVSDTMKKLEEEREKVVLDLQEAKEANINH